MPSLQSKQLRKKLMWRCEFEATISTTKNPHSLATEVLISTHGICSKKLMFYACPTATATGVLRLRLQALQRAQITL